MKEERGSTFIWSGGQTKKKTINAHPVVKSRNEFYVQCETKKKGEDVKILPFFSLAIFGHECDSLITLYRPWYSTPGCEISPFLAFEKRNKMSDKMKDQFLELQKKRGYRVTSSSETISESPCTVSCRVEVVIRGWMLIPHFSKMQILYCMYCYSELLLILRKILFFLSYLLNLYGTVCLH